MEILTETHAEALRGGGLSINVAPTIVVNTALQTNSGANVAVGVLGGRAGANFTQSSLLGRLKASR